jgi:hypothetical protein
MQRRCPLSAGERRIAFRAAATVTLTIAARFSAAGAGGRSSSSGPEVLLPL